MQKFAKHHASFFKMCRIHHLLQNWSHNESTAKFFNAEQNVVYGGDLKIPTHSHSFGSLLFNRLMLSGRRNDVFQIDARTKKQMTTKEFLEKSIAFAKRLQEEDVKRGDYIILVGANSLNMNVSLIGAFLTGAIPFPMSNKVNLDEFQKIMKLLKPKYFGCDEKYLYFFKKAVRDSPDFNFCKLFILNTTPLDMSDSTIAFEELIKGREENFEYFTPPDVEDTKNDLALVMKASAEKADERLVGLTHHNINSIIARYDAMLSYRNLKEEVILMVQKNVWMSGLYCLFLSCCHGSKLIVMHKFEEESFLKAIDEFKIISDSTSEYARPHERGELCFKGPIICKGYLNDEKRFKESFDEEGYFLSGHYGYYDEDGDIFIIDSISNQIQYQNYKILPKELEAIIKSLDSVKDVCVAGLKHEVDGEHPFAIVSVQKGHSITGQEILNFVNERVPEHKKIRGVIFISKMPRIKESGSINRVLLKKILSKLKIKTKQENDTSKAE